MFIPKLNSSTKIVNETLVYCDTILNANYLGNNIKVTEISNVGEYSLKNCIKTILDSNSSVIFNTIQYSKNEKKLYFYTNLEINTKAWGEKSQNLSNPLTSEIEILREIKKVIESSDCKRDDSVSLYDIYHLIKERRNEYEKVRGYFNDALRILLKCTLGNVNSCIYDFDYKNKNLKIGIKTFVSYNYEDIIITKKDGELVIVSSEFDDSEMILEIAGNLLSKFYDRMIEFTEINEQFSYDVQSVNSNFIVGISKHGVQITNKEFDSDFKLVNLSCDDTYEYKCNYIEVYNFLKNNENKLFKKIFIKLDDCPEWARAYLYVGRTANLTEYRMEEQKKEKREIKRVRYKNFGKKIFPFGKK